MSVAYDDPNNGQFWDDWLRAEELRNALKTATPAEALILKKALEPIAKRQEIYWAGRQAEYEVHAAEVQARIAAFSKKLKEQSL